LFLASLPPGFPQNPNVLLIRTHPNPFPSVGYMYTPIAPWPGVLVFLLLCFMSLYFG
jgi:hypothetical protein